MSRRIGADDVEINRTDQRGVYFGAWSAYLGERAPQVYNASVRAVKPIAASTCSTPLTSRA